MRGHLQQRGPQTWRLAVYVGRDERTAKKRYVQRTVHGTQREAERALARLVTEVDEGRHAPSASGTVGALLDRWLETKALSVEASTPRVRAQHNGIADPGCRRRGRGPGHHPAGRYGSCCCDCVSSSGGIGFVGSEAALLMTRHIRLTASSIDIPPGGGMDR